jgi:hypothetical protein
MAKLLNTACQAQRPGEPGASTSPTVPGGLVEGMSYAEVRSRLIDAGWEPKTTPMDHYTGLEQTMYIGATPKFAAVQALAYAALNLTTATPALWRTAKP